MAKSVRERILEQRVETIKAVTTAGGYEVDVKAVDRHRRTPYQQHELPAVNLWEGREIKQPGPAGLTTCFLPLVLEITVLGTAELAELSNQVMAAVMKAILADPTCGGLAIDTEEGNNEPFIGEESETRGGVRIGLKIEYRHRQDDPYQSG